MMFSTEFRVVGLCCCLIFVMIPGNLQTLLCRLFASYLSYSLGCSLHQLPHCLATVSCRCLSVTPVFVIPAAQVMDPGSEFFMSSRFNENYAEFASDLDVYTCAQTGFARGSWWVQILPSPHNVTSVILVGKLCLVQKFYTTCKVVPRSCHFICSYCLSTIFTCITQVKQQLIRFVQGGTLGIQKDEATSPRIRYVTILQRLKNSRQPSSSVHRAHLETSLVYKLSILHQLVDLCCVKLISTSRIYK